MLLKSISLFSVMSRSILLIKNWNITVKAFFISKNVFSAIAFDLDNKIIVVQVVLLANLDLVFIVHPFYKAFVKANKTHIFVSYKYTNLVNIFSKNLAVKILKYIRTNYFAINLVKHQ